jgi:exodeoxyribonuclease V beta subunit
MKSYSSKQDLKIIPKVNITEASSIEEGYKKAFSRTAEKWSLVREDVKKIFSLEVFNKNKYPSRAIQGWTDKMDEYLNGGWENFLIFKEFEKFTSSKISGSVKKGCNAPSHPFFVLCDELQIRQRAVEEFYDNSIIQLKTELFEYLQKELELRKQRENIFAFDDLLNKLHIALTQKQGENLAGNIRKKFSAALIDEFQDTDPVQYGIFNKIFGKDSILYLIGDPKQSIYGFRGADIFAYMDASKKVQNCYTLEKNWRSEPGLVKAVNTFFGNVDHAFVYREIDFHPVQASEKTKDSALTINGSVGPPMQMWYVDLEDLGVLENCVTKKKAREVIPGAVAAEVSRLLDMGGKKKALLGDKPLMAGDIAVLVRRNLEAVTIRDALFNLDVPAVIHSTDSIFNSFEASEIRQLLSGIVHANNDKNVRAALSTLMMGVCGEELDLFAKDDDKWESWLIRFKEYHDMWSTAGFIRMFNFLINRENILTRLMAFKDGERRCTNLLHIMEVLHGASVKNKTGKDGLLKWMSSQMDAPDATEHQLRLESDENAVKIVTVHKSKGLEYPVVFCPFTWDGSKMVRGKEPFVFHDKDDNMRMTLDLGSENMKINLGFAQKELLAENLRLLYVAMTRAKNRCYIVWGRIKEAETSAPAYLLHTRTTHIDPENHSSFIADLESGLKSLCLEEFKDDLKTIEKKSEENIGVLKMPADSGQGYAHYIEDKDPLVLRKFSSKIDRSRSIASFSSIVSKRAHGAELADHDTVLQVKKVAPGDPFKQPDSKDLIDIFSFPKGAKPGIFVHDIFEHLDFTHKDPSYLKELVDQKITQYGIDGRWTEVVCEMVRNVLSVKLDQNHKDLQLAKISDSKRINEMEFYFPLKRVMPEKLSSIFKKHGAPVNGSDFPLQVGQLSFSPVKGFMKGFVDLVFSFEDLFFIIDWKSNYLGDSIEEYSQDAILGAMEKEMYILQYHIYTLALDRYLKQRMAGYSYKRNFGGVYYIFLRGVDHKRGPEFGVYSDRPSEKLIEELSFELMGRN